MTRLGLDLGTTRARAARVAAQGAPVLIPDHRATDQFETPATVQVGSAGALVGQLAEDFLDDAGGPPAARDFMWRLGSPDAVLIDTQGRKWPPEAVAALLLRKLRRDVEAHTDTAVEGAALAVPLHFADPQRRALCEAARLAEMQILELVDEPLATAVHYGAHDAPPQTTFLTLGVGGRHAWASVLSVQPEGLQMLGRTTASDLGGSSFDEVVMALLGEQLHASRGDDPRTDSPAATAVRRAAEALKLRVAAPGATVVRAAILLGGRVRELVISRRQFERMSAPLVDRVGALCESALREAGFKWNQLTQVLLAGGSSRLPALEPALRRWSGLPPERVRRHQPERAVAYGAALLAAGGVEPTFRLPPRIAGADLGFRVIDPTTRRPVVDVVIPRNTPVPAHKATVYYSNRADQRRMVFEVVQVIEPGSPPISLGDFAFPLERPGKSYPLEISLGYDALGLATVEARDPTTGRETRREFGRPGDPGAVNADLVSAVRILE